jgi:serine protease SohB
LENNLEVVLTEYFVFLAKFITVFLGIILLFISLAIIKIKSRKIRSEGNIEVKDMTAYYEHLKLQMLQESGNKKEIKAFLKKLKAKKKEKDCITSKKQKIFLLRFDGDMKANAVESLKEEVNAVLSVVNKSDKVVISLESPGGVVSGYGLAASELTRFKANNIHLTALVDKVAASGGYMMASVADEIIAAPFAIIGSIGVLAQIPNFHQLLSEKGIKMEQVMSGKHKRTLTMFGKNDSEGRKKMQQELDEIHVKFKDLIKEHRPNVDLKKIATGEYWLANRAIEMGLVDGLMTSEAYLTKLHNDGKQIFCVTYKKELPLFEKISKSVLSLKNIFHPLP